MPYLTSTILLKVKNAPKRLVLNRVVKYKTTVDAVIDMATMKDLWSCDQRKEALSIFLAAKLTECKKDSQTTYVVHSNGDCVTIGDKMS